LHLSLLNQLTKLNLILERKMPPIFNALLCPISVLRIFHAPLSVHRRKIHLSEVKIYLPPNIVARIAHPAMIK